MKDQKRGILTEVAAGRITPEEAANRLEELEAETPKSSVATSVETPPPPQPDGPVKRVKVISSIGTAEIIGDPTVAFVVAEGTHRARQEGDTMIIEHAPFEESNHFVFGRSGRRFVINGLDVHDRRVTIRINPDLPLTASIAAGSLRVSGCHSTIDAEVQAGSCRIDDFCAPLNIHVQAGSVSARGRLDAGDSTIRCEMGTVKVHFTQGSSVRVSARSTLGRVSAESEGDDAVVLGEGGKQVTFGSGKGTLNIDTTMGSVKLWCD